MGVIYKIENTLNGKVYIGKTARSVEIRWKEHLACSLTQDNKLYRALRKYPISVFFISIIEEASDNLLNDLERYWIDQYDSYQNGYNSTLGGDGTQTTDYNIIYQLWDKKLNYDQIHQETGYPKSTIRHILNTYERYSVFDARSRGSSKRKAVKQYNFAGSLMEEYESITAASLATGLSVAMICFCCEGIRLSGGGFQWRYSDDPPPSKLFFHPPKAVLQFTMDNQYICTFRSAKEASEISNIPLDGIYKCCNGRIKSSGGYKWKYSDWDEAKNDVE